MDGVGLPLESGGGVGVLHPVSIWTPQSPPNPISVNKARFSLSVLRSMAATFAVELSDSISRRVYFGNKKPTVFSDGGGLRFSNP